MITAAQSAAMRLAQRAKYADQASRVVQIGVWTIAPDFLRGDGGRGAGFKLTAPGQPARWYSSVEKAADWIAVRDAE